MVSFNPSKDISDLSGKVIIVTGGNVGLGKETVEQLAKHSPQHIYLGARSAEKAEQALADIKKVLPDAHITHLPLDLSSFKSIKAAVDNFTASNDRLDLLINNAGIMACPPALTTEGYETQFGTNHVGHALLTKLLLPTLKKTAGETGADVRVVNLTSMGHQLCPKGGVVFDQLKSKQEGISTWTRYGQSKLANILFTKELAKQNPDIKCTAIHPGVVNTNLTAGPQASYPLFASLIKLASPFMSVSVQKGALNQLWAATSTDAQSGQYYVPVGKPNAGSKYAQDATLAKELWDWTEKQFAEHGY